MQLPELPSGLTEKARPWVVLSGLCMLVPLPILDDWLATRCTRRAVRELAEARGATLDATQIAVLVDDPFSLAQGCLTLALWPFKKFFRTLLYFLTIKDVLDRTAASALKVEAVSTALHLGHLPEHAPRVRAAMDEAFGQVHTSPVLRWILRHERPAVPHLSGALGWLVVQAGAGLVLPRFLAQLEVRR